MRCPACSTENSSDFSYCGHCGAALPRQCPNCGLENPQDASFCGYCGASLAHLSAASLRAALEGERRFVVILFADMAGFTHLSEQLDAEEAIAMVNLCMEHLTEVIVQHGGHIDKYVGDGVMALFGAPQGHEDDPERALRTALAMKQAITQVKFDAGIPPISLHIGIACGQVVAAGVGGKGHKEYTVIGSAVNLAARLEDASLPGQILVSQEMAHLAEPAFAFQPVTLPYVHGLEGPVLVYELQGECEQARRAQRARELRSPLVGREAELSQFADLMQALQAGQGGIVSLIGEAGVGKSRLLDQVQKQARERGLSFAWLEGNALEIGESARYGHFRTLIRNAIAATERAEPRDTAERLGLHLEQVAPGRVGEIYPYLGRVLGILLEQQAAERLERLDGESLKWQTFRGVQEWLHTLARRGPLVLVFDNLHWIDPISAELLDQVIALAEQTAVLIIGVYRPEPDSLAWRLREATRQQANLYAEIWLRPLPQRATEHMVRHMLVDAPQPVLDLAWQRTEGNPLFVEEIVRSMVDQHVLVQRQDGVWELASGWAQANIPNTVHGILQSRVDRLDAEARRALQVAACIGRRFPYALLAMVGETVGVPAAHLDPCLRALEQATLIQREGAPEGAPESGRETESPVREYSFKYMLIRDIAHGNLLKSARSQMHTAIAQWYEVNALSSPEPPYGLLAYHYEQTDNIKKQQHYLMLAGQQAARVYANQEAYTCFAKALVLAREPAERFDLLQACERVLEVLGDRAQQQSNLEELLDLANQLEDNQRRAIVYNRMAALHASQGEYTSALQVAKEGQAAAHQSGDSRAETESLQIIASTAWRQGRFEAALDAAQAAVALARAVDDAALEATSLTTMGIIHRSMGDPDSARAGYEQALAIRRSAGDQRGEAISLNQLGNLCYDRGDYSGALEHYRPALDLFRKVGDRRGEAWSLSGLGTIYLRCGDYEAARASYQEALSLRRMVRDQRGEAVTLADLGNALAGLDELEPARTHLEQAVSLTRSLGAHRDEVYALTYLARALEKSGDLAGAEAAHQSALAARQAQKQHAGSLENLAGLARIALERQAQEQARAHVEEILSTMREHGWLAAESPFLVYQTCVRVLQAAGDDAGARETLSTAWRTLGDWADRIADPLLRQSFLERVPENRDLRALWREASGA